MSSRTQSPQINVPMRKEYRIFLPDANKKSKEIFFEFYFFSDKITQNYKIKIDT